MNAFVALLYIFGICQNLELFPEKSWLLNESGEI